MFPYRVYLVLFFSFQWLFFRGRLITRCLKRVSRTQRNNRSLNMKHWGKHGLEVITSRRQCRCNRSKSLVPRDFEIIRNNVQKGNFIEIINFEGLVYSGYSGIAGLTKKFFSPTRTSEDSIFNILFDGTFTGLVWFEIVDTVTRILCRLQCHAVFHSGLEKVDPPRVAPPGTLVTCPHLSCEAVRWGCCHDSRVEELSIIDLTLSLVRAWEIESNFRVPTEVNFFGANEKTFMTKKIMKIRNEFFWDPENAKSGQLVEILKILKSWKYSLCFFASDVKLTYECADLNEICSVNEIYIFGDELIRMV